MESNSLHAISSEPLRLLPRSTYATIVKIYQRCIRLLHVLRLSQILIAFLDSIVGANNHVETSRRTIMQFSYHDNSAITYFIFCFLFFIGETLTILHDGRAAGFHHDSTSSMRSPGTKRLAVDVLNQLNHQGSPPDRHRAERLMARLLARPQCGPIYDCICPRCYNPRCPRVPTNSTCASPPFCPSKKSCRLRSATKPPLPPPPAPSPNDPTTKISTTTTTETPIRPPPPAPPPDYIDPTPIPIPILPPPSPPWRESNYQEPPIPDDPKRNLVLPQPQRFGGFRFRNRVEPSNGRSVSENSSRKSKHKSEPADEKTKTGRREKNLRHWLAEPHRWRDFDERRRSRGKLPHFESPGEISLASENLDKVNLDEGERQDIKAMIQDVDTSSMDASLVDKLIVLLDRLDDEYPEVRLGEPTMSESEPYLGSGIESLRGRHWQPRKEIFQELKGKVCKPCPIEECDNLLYCSATCPNNPDCPVHTCSCASFQPLIE